MTLEQVSAIARSTNTSAPIALPSGLCCTVSAEGERHTIVAKRLREERVADPANREALVSCGVAVEHVVCELERRNHFVEVVVLPSGGSGSGRVIAQVHAFARPEPPEPRPDLRTKRLPIPVVLRTLREGARREHAWVDGIVDDCRRELIADLLARHLATNSPIGAGHFAPALRPMLESTGCSLAAATCEAGELRSRARDADLLFVLGVQRDEPSHWVNAGRVLYRSLLLTAVDGRLAEVLSAPLDDPQLRDALRPLLFAGGVPLVVVALV